ncbi:MAG: recombinase RecT [Patescibacteria group bacterium]|nr:recombinase RecT [Patescibacteria group bacterium]
MTLDIVKIKEEIEMQCANKEVFLALLTTTFRGLEEQNVKKAIFEGMLRGFVFQDFLEKNVFAIPYNNRKTGVQEYSLVTSVDYARKIGAENGIVGKSAPVYAEEVRPDGKKQLISCTVTVQKKNGDTVGDFSSTVFFSEYTTGFNLWISKPRTMLAKVAEMSALRMACPEKLSKAYAPEEMERDTVATETKPKVLSEDFKAKLEATNTLEKLKVVWSALPVEVKNDPVYIALKNTLKKKYEDTSISK